MGMRFPGTAFVRSSGILAAMGALDELLAQWRANPDADRTVALCSYLGYSKQPDLIREVGARSEVWHARDGDVMLAVGRMYLDGHLLGEAQAALVMASKANPRDAKPLRFLGEALLRLGDAQRAEKVLGRALQFGSDDEIRLWQERATLYVALQRRVGPEAVAREVERSLPNEPSIPPPSQASEAAPRPSELTDDLTIARPLSRSLRARGAAAPPPPRTTAPRPGAGATPAPAARASVTPPTTSQARSSGTPSAAAPAAAASPVTRPAAASPMARPTAASPVARPTAASPVTRPASSLPAVPQSPIVARPPPIPLEAPPPAARSAFDFAAESRQQPASAPQPNTTSAPAVTARPGSGLGARTAFGLGPTELQVPVAAPLFPSFSGSASSAPPAAPLQGSTPDSPAPGVVLEHLARVGVYEPSGGPRPAWERPTLEKTRGVWIIAAAIAVLVAGGSTGFYFAQTAKQARLAQAVELNAEIERLLKTGDVADLIGTDDKLSRSLELDSRSPTASVLWLRNRVLRALLLSDEPRGIDGAIHRARGLGIPEEQLAFATIVGFFSEGDLAGAAAVLPKWDTLAAQDPYYQLAAGSVLEAAGDPRAMERYEAARRLDKSFLVADMLLTRLVLLELGVAKGKPLLDEVARKLGDNGATNVLRALAWAVDPSSSPQLPADVKLPAEAVHSLSAPLRLVARYVDGVRALNEGKSAEARSAIEQALGLTRGPALASQLGLLAIRLGDAELARKAALTAVRFNAAYLPARVLAARVALAADRIEEAENAIKGSEIETRDAFIVRAVVAYESLKGDEFEKAENALLEEKQAELAGIRAAHGVFTGQRYPAPDSFASLAAANVPWGDIVALDSALDTGELAAAEQLVSSLGERMNQPAHQQRLARLQRYRGKNDQALKLTAGVLENLKTPQALIERAYALFAAERYHDVKTLIERHGADLGPAKIWIDIWHYALTEGRPAAQKRLALLDLPPPDAPFALRVLVANAVAAARDTRAAAYITRLARAVRKQPDVLSAAESLTK